MCWRISTILGQEWNVPVVDVLSLSDTLGDLARRRSRDEITDAGEGAVPLLDGVERSLVGAGNVVAANLPDVISKVKRSLHIPQLVLDGPSDALQVLECLHFGDPFVQHRRCHEHRLQMDDCSRPFKGQVIPH